MENFLISINDIAKILCFTGDKAVRHTHDWLLERGIRQFRRGGYYSRDIIYDLLRKESEKCLLGKEGNTTMSGQRYVLVKRPSKFQNTVRDVLNAKKQESILT